MASRAEGHAGEADQQLRDLIADFHARADRGETVDRTQFVAQHPEFREQLTEYFDEVATSTNLSPAEGTVVAAGSRSGNFDETMIEGSHAGDNARLNSNAPRTQFGRYRILNELGRGAMGAVYLAHDEQLDREIALKIPQFGQDLNPDLLERFYREARAAAALRHPGICPVYDVGEIDGQHYITMAFIKGRPLRDFTKTTKTQGVRQIVRVIRKLAIALEVAHRHKVVHRDLKPANVMIDESKEPVVMDFGLARRTAEKEEKLTHSGTVIGTPAYMSPEQVDGDNDRVGPPADIYSLGVIFYELLTGQLPFQGSLMSILKQIATVDPKPPSEFRDDLPREVEAICQKMMAKQIEDRYQTMDQVSAALTGILKDQKAGTEESGMLEATKAPVRRRKKVEIIEVTETMTMPGRSPQEPLDEEFAQQAEESFHYEPVVSRRRSRSAKAKSVRAKTDQRKMLIAAGIGGALLLTVIAFFLIPGRKNETTTVESPAENPPTEEAAWRELFTGTDLTGWKVVGYDGWSVANGVITGETTSSPGWLMSDSEFEDLELELEYLLTSGSNSGVFLRAWPDGPVSGGSFDEIQLLDDTAANHAGVKDVQRTGALFGHVAPDPVLLPKPDEWHRLWIRAVGKQVTVRINGTEVLATSLSEAKRSRGHIGLQLYPKKVQFRNIRIREISMSRLVKKYDRNVALVPAVAPFDAATAKKQQQAWADYLGVPIDKEVELPGGVKMAFMLIPPGEFLMGSPESERQQSMSSLKTSFDKNWASKRYPSEGPQHLVKISKPFWLGTYEVTQEQYEKVMGSNPSQFNGNSQHPVDSVTWDDVQTFLVKVEQSAGNQRLKLQLPTEAQWEYACRAGTTTTFGFGDDEAKLGEFAWFKENSKSGTRPVGQKKSNRWGLHDLHGNVWEWCVDRFESDYYANSPKLDPTGPTSGSLRILRSGAWDGPPLHCRSAIHSMHETTFRLNSIGFRVAMTIETAKLKMTDTPPVDSARDVAQ